MVLKNIGNELFYMPKIYRYQFFVHRRLIRLTCYSRNDEIRILTTKMEFVIRSDHTIRSDFALWSVFFTYFFHICTQFFPYYWEVLQMFRDSYCIPFFWQQIGSIILYTLERTFILIFPAVVFFYRIEKRPKNYVKTDKTRVHRLCLFSRNS